MYFPSELKVFMCENLISSECKIFYLDTSGINYFADNAIDFDLLSFLKKNLKFDLFLSPINLWEIMLNSDEKRRDYLIYWSQFNCAKYLLKSPAEIILNYIQSGCPLKSRRFFYENPFTKTEIGKTWTNIHGKIEKNISFDFEELKIRSATARNLSKKLKLILESMCNTTDLIEQEYDALQDPFHIAMEQALKNLNRPITPNKRDEKLLKISLILAFFVFCIGLELQNSMVNDFWGILEIPDPFDRFNYLIKNYPVLMVRGPLLEMAKMVEIQICSGKSRGLIHDSFHSVYCYYSHKFITGDLHFKNLRDITYPSIFNSIVMAEEIEKSWKLISPKIKHLQ